MENIRPGLFGPITPRRVYVRKPDNVTRQIRVNRSGCVDVNRDSDLFLAVAAIADGVTPPVSGMHAGTVYTHGLGEAEHAVQILCCRTGLALDQVVDVTDDPEQSGPLVRRHGEEAAV